MLEARNLGCFLLPRKKFNFQWFNGKPIGWQKVKVLTSLGKMHQTNASYNPQKENGSSHTPKNQKPTAGSTPRRKARPRLHWRSGRLLHTVQAYALSPKNKWLWWSKPLWLIPVWSNWVSSPHILEPGFEWLDWDVHWGYDSAFDPWPNRKIWFGPRRKNIELRLNTDYYSKIMRKKTASGLPRVKQGATSFLRRPWRLTSLEFRTHVGSFAQEVTPVASCNRMFQPVLPEPELGVREILKL